MISPLSAQENVETLKYSQNNKGKFFISWGANRAAYSKSDITFKGEGFNFTIQDASAVDKPKGYHVDHINPLRMTIPQTNLKIGYFFSDKYNIAFGIDHMKYVMNRNKIKNVVGFINLNEDEEGSVYNNTFNGDPYFISEDFLMFEHTNGLNFIYLEVARFDDISGFFNIYDTDIFQINLTEGFDFGVLEPKTNTTLLKKERLDEFHLSGYGLAAFGGINLTFFKHYYLEGSLKSGYIDMNDIIITDNKNDRASQSFYYFESVLSIGGRFRI